MDTMFIFNLARTPIGLVETWDMPVIGTLALVPTVIAAALYFLFQRSRPELRHFSYIPLVLGVILGLVSWFDSTRPGVKDFGEFGRKISFMFIAMWVLPAVGAIGLFVWDKFGQGSKRANY